MTLGPSDITRGPLDEALLSALRWNAVFLVWEAGLSETEGYPGVQLVKGDIMRGSHTHRGG